MNNLNKTFRHLVLALFLLPIVATAQNVTNARFYQDGKTIVVEYGLDLKTDISLLLSTDGGKTFGTPLNDVTGDVGKDVKPGNNTIIWRPLLTREELIGDNFVFKVVAKKQNVFNTTYLLHTIPMQPIQPVLGITFSINPYGKWYGWYISTTHSPYSYSDIAGHINGWDISGDNNYKGVVVSYHSFATGPMFNIKNIVKIYVGVNVGSDGDLWQTFNNQLVYARKFSEGVGVDAGIIFNYHGMTFSAGLATIEDGVYTKLGIGFTTHSAKRGKKY